MISLLSTKLLAIGDERRGDLAEAKSDGPSPVAKGRQRDDVDDEAERPDEGEQHEADRQHAAARVMDDETEKIEADQRRQFRFARDPLAEAGRAPR